LHWVGLSKALAGIVHVYRDGDATLHAYSINGQHLASTDCKESLNVLVYSLDGETLVTGGERRELCMYDACNLSMLMRFNGAYRPYDVGPFPSKITSIYLSNTPEERHLIVGLENGSLYVIVLDAQYLRERLQQKLANLGF